MCISDTIQDNIVYDFLSQLKEMFIAKYEKNVIYTAVAYTLRDFNQDIKRLTSKLNISLSSKRKKRSLNKSLTASNISFKRESVAEILTDSERLDFIINKKNSQSSAPLIDKPTVN